MALKIKLVRSIAGASLDQLATIKGLGLRKFGDERLLQDSADVRGMVFKVKHLLQTEQVAGDAPRRARTGSRKDRLRRAARAKDQAAQ
jgi:large subunit ribosomal protein L30